VLYREIVQSRNDATSLVEAILEEIVIALSSGDMVKLTSFGNFSVKQKKLRMGRNPKTGKEIPIPPRQVVVFRASQILKDRINHRPAGTTGRGDGDGDLLV
jgi:integration host factor subunit alpha